MKCVISKSTRYAKISFIEILNTVTSSKKVTTLRIVNNVRCCTQNSNSINVKYKNVKVLTLNLVYLRSSVRLTMS